MSRKSLERRRLASERWPLLSDLLGLHFNQDYELLWGSLDGAMAAAGRDGPLEHRRALLKEWRDWNASEGAVDDIQPFLQDGFGVDLLFESPLAARKFMNRLHDELLVGVKAESRRDDRAR
jgi:hypothetical protein